jgi:hypothetical protein
LNRKGLRYQIHEVSCLSLLLQFHICLPASLLLQSLIVSYSLLQSLTVKYTLQHRVFKHPQYLKNAVLWDVAPRVFRKNRRFGVS